MEMKYLVARPWGGYERRMITLLSLSFGLVGLDRFIIMPLFPVIMRDLALDYQDLSMLSAILAFAWGGSALFMGAAIRVLGPKKLLVLSITLLSILAGASALITGLVGLVLLRALMGVCEGAFTPVSIIVTDEVSQPSRRGLNLGIQQALFPIIGLCLGPLLAGVLLEMSGSWRAVFAIISLPGLLVAWYLYRTYQPTQAPSTESIAYTSKSQWRAALSCGNVRLNIALMLCILTCQFVLCALLPSYLTDILHLSNFSMAMIISAIGLGGFFGQLVIPGLSDQLGRKPVVSICFMISALLVGLLIISPPLPWLLFLQLFFLSFINFSLICMTVGPLTSESVPPSLLATATGLVVGCGEILGGGVAPVVAGYIAMTWGLTAILFLALAGSITGGLLSLRLKEANPAFNGLKDYAPLSARLTLEDK
ncbi:Predicted arabinose efflux permease, MFS family [Pseudomonas sp. NFACC07-1]|nr:Predicted arabinose efflux permease, MFS family [Pseudomonas sp. NFACC07-1]